MREEVKKVELAVKASRRRGSALVSRRVSHRSWDVPML